MSREIPGLTEKFRLGLEWLDMIVPENQEYSGLVFADQIPSDKYERFALDKARKYSVDAIYFRRFDTDRASIPQVYIYDFTQKEWNEDEVGELQRRLWNSGQVPLFFIFTRTEIKIFNCLQKPEIDINKGKVVSSPMETILLAAHIENELNKLKEFSAQKIDNGSFWETSVYKDEFKLSGTSYETLIVNLKKIRNDLIQKGILEKEIVQKLLVKAILVKYLEERKDDKGNKVFPSDFFNNFVPGAVQFTDILKKRGACLKLFDYLSKHFNGEIFEWKDESEREILSQADLFPFADFLEGRTEITGQLTLWPLYSFNDLPIELISNIYEEFLGDEKGIVYTPPYLVHFLIDEAMPLNSPMTHYKILDPACGSGIFLVAAYKRIIEWWRIQHDWKIPDLNTLKTLLRENIFGVDIDPGAVLLTIFSLSLVLFDELSPKVIWEELRFDNLKSTGNLFDKDFFELISSQELKEKFDLVIGNPPFIADFTTSYAKEVAVKQWYVRRKIPDNQLALLFLEQALTVCKADGLLCLIVPSGSFLYNYGSSEFRTYFLQKCNVKQLLDFSFLREILFGSANAAVVAVFAKNENPESKNLLHATFRRTKLSKEKIYLELDHYDLHIVPYKKALKSPLIWKANLLGGGRLEYLIDRLANQKIRKLGEYLQEKIDNDGWVVAEGFKSGKKHERIRLKKYLAKNQALTPKENKELQRLQKKYEKADFLTNKQTMPTKALSVEGIDESQIQLLKQDFFHRSAKENQLIFKGPHLLIKKGATTSIPIAFRDDDLSFKNQIIGIHAPEEDREQLLEIESKIRKNKVILFCAGAFSRKHLLDRGSAILKKDIENIPFPEDIKELDISEIEKILIDDVLNYMPDFRNNGEKSKVMKPVTREQLDLFGETFCKVLNSVYEKFNPSKPVITDNFIFFPIFYGVEPFLLYNCFTDLIDELKQLIYKKNGRNLRIARVLRIYDANIIYLIKPNQLRFWLCSMAVRDADETFADLVKQGY